MNCKGNNIGRRSFLHVGFLGGLGLTLSDYFRMKTVQADQKFYESVEGPAKSVIFVYLPGGMAHQETFDPKPFAPLEYRGPMSSIETVVPGTRLNEMMAKTAKVTDKMTIIRSMTHGEAAHERGTHNMFTGYRPSPALQYPSMGSVVAHEFGPRQNLPPYVCIPNQPNEFAGTGYLSSSFSGFSLGADPASAGFQVRDLKLPTGVNDGRFGTRRKMLSAVNDYFANKEKSDSLDAVDSFYDRAYSLISSEKARDAFDINKESDAMRDKYGRNTAGSRMLLARRLVEAGTRFVTLTYGGWDMHSNISNALKGKVPPIDKALAGFMQDVSDKGLGDKVLLVVTGEFGRTKINANAGRDHWPSITPMFMFGGEYESGRTIGLSDRSYSPVENPVGPLDLQATLFNHFGIDQGIQRVDNGGRPRYLLEGEAKVIL